MVLTMERNCKNCKGTTQMLKFKCYDEENSEMLLGTMKKKITVSKLQNYSM